MKTSHIPSLDGIRTISVFLVLLSHSGLGHIVPGGLGVTAFFFLSGFLITTLLLKEHEHSKTINVKLFFARRFFRLSPPLVITLTIAYSLCFFGLLGGGVSTEGALSQIFYLANYHSIFQWPGAIPDGTHILWSLAVEEHFYFFYPILFLLCMAKMNKLHFSHTLLILCIFILCWRSYLILIEGAQNTRIYYASDTRIDSILFGCILAISFNPTQVKASNKLSIEAVMAISLSGLAIIISLLIRSNEFRETLRYTLQSLSLMAIFYCAIKYHSHWMFSWLSWRWMQRLGIYSYSMYLIHYILIEAIEHNNLTPSIPVTILIVSLISVLYGILIDTFVDKHFKKLRSRLR